MSSIKTIFVVILIGLAIVFGLRIFSPEDTWVCKDGSWQKHGNPSNPAPTTPCGEKSQQAEISTSSSSAKETESTKKNIYENQKMGFSVVLPEGLKPNENIDGTVTFSKWGPTQKTDTEMFDGYSVNIDQGSIGVNKSLKTLIEADIVQKKEQLGSDFKVIKQISSIGQNGYQFSAEDAFGIVNYYYLPQSEVKFLIISTIIKDPGKLGFEETVNGIISGITMTK